MEAKIYLMLQEPASFSCLESVDWRPCPPTVNSLTKLLTPCSKPLLDKLTGSHLVKKFPVFYGTRRFIPAFTSARQMFLSWTRPIQSMPPPTSGRSTLILSSHLRLGLPSGLFPSGCVCVCVYIYIYIFIYIYVYIYNSVFFALCDGTQQQDTPAHYRWWRISLIYKFETLAV
jgi:hypothetical protein